MGKAKDLKSRVSSYFTKSSDLGAKTAALVSQIKKIEITIVESELESLLLEAFYIKKFQPKYNIRLTDNKTYPLIKITYKDASPAVLMARRIDDPKASYFGPYPSASAVKLVLRTIRRAFPFQSTSNHPKRLCLYHHLGLCPCLPMHISPEEFKKYKKDLKNVIRILDGESQTILKELEKDRDVASKAENYAEAAKLQKRVQAMQFITQPFRLPFEYDLNPNLRTDIRQEELEELRLILNGAGYNIPFITKIECYDISHIQGTNTVASMVVFVDGEKESALYRKFKIRLEKTPDDFASMREVLQRRMNHTDEWPLPELLIVDGGKGQVSAAMDVITELGITIPLIGLAKREETIVVPMNHPRIRLENLSSSTEVIEMNEMEKFTAHSSPLRSNKKIANSDNFMEILLPKRTKALQLIQRIRDEAHRFAITYHRLLRSKKAISG
ncbi:excinuclease ABC subunit UvrC [soil metagenome]